MNTIKAEIDKSEYGYDDFLNYRIDDFWLDEKLEELYPDNWYGGTIPTLSLMEIEKEERIVWQRILPKEGQVFNCPILMCPDDNDFSCTIIIAEIENNKETIKWKRLGIDQTEEHESNKIGTTVKWLDKIKSFEFSKSDYLKMIEDFKEQFEIDKKDWRKRVFEMNKK
jgi:hypothetical protein